MKQSRPGYSPSDHAIDTAAAAWLCERDEGFVPGRAAAFAAWRAADPRHEDAVRRTESALALIAELPAVRAELTERLAVLRSRPVASVPWWHGFRAAAWTAGLAAAIVLAAGLWWWQAARSGEAQHFATAPAQQEQVALKDGSVVNLNGGSEVKLQFGARERRVTLAAGEAHFAVAPDVARPFIVTAAGVTVRAVGTAFNVRIGNGGVEVLVTEGKVEVGGSEGPTSPTAAVPAERPRLVAGERVAIPRHRTAAPAKIEQVSVDALRAATAWHSPVITFYDLPLSLVVAQFNRRNALQLVVADAALNARRIAGTLPADKVEAFVRLLEQDGDIVAERREKGKIVLRRAP